LEKFWERGRAGAGIDVKISQFRIVANMFALLQDVFVVLINSASALFLFLDVALPLGIGLFFIFFLWNRKRGAALLAAGLMAAARLIFVTVTICLRRHMAFPIAVQNLTLSIPEIVLPLAVMALIFRFIREQKKRQIVLPAVLCVVLLIPAFVVFDAIAFKSMSIRDAQALYDNMQNQHVVGWSEDELIRLYGQPDDLLGSGVSDGVVHWIYNPNPWFIYGNDVTDVGIEHGKVINLTFISF
jgi:hypothetical protein